MPTYRHEYRDKYLAYQREYHRKLKQEHPELVRERNLIAVRKYREKRRTSTPAN